MPTLLAARVALGIGTALTLAILVTVVAPPAMQLLAAVFSLPIGAAIVTYARPLPRPRTRLSSLGARPMGGPSWTVSSVGMDQSARVHSIRPIPPPAVSQG